jgi:hypothetical protein
MKIGLIPYERRSLELLEKKFFLERETVIGFAQSLNVLFHLYERVALNFKGDFSAGRVVIIGLINHTHNLLIGGLQALEAGNGAVWSACLRGLMETFGACVLISEEPMKAPSFLEGGKKTISAGKLRSAAERGKKGLEKDISRLNKIVHPDVNAIFASFTIANAKENIIKAHFGLQPPTAEDGREGVIILANMAALLEQRFAELVSREDVLSSGKLLMQR